MFISAIVTESSQIHIGVGFESVDYGLNLSGSIHKIIIRIEDDRGIAVIAGVKAVGTDSQFVGVANEYVVAPGQ